MQLRPSLLVMPACLVIVLGLSACASLSDKTNSSNTEAKIENLGMLPPQTLAAGSCGLFVWTADNQNKFIGFETQGRAKYIVNEKMYLAKRSDNGALNALNRDYQTDAAIDVEPTRFQLVLKRDKEIADGERFYGRLSTKTEDGWDRVTPVAALLNCADR